MENRTGPPVHWWWYQKPDKYKKSIQKNCSHLPRFGNILTEWIYSTTPELHCDGDCWFKAIHIIQIITRQFCSETIAWDWYKSYRFVLSKSKFGRNFGESLCKVYFHIVSSSQISVSWPKSNYWVDQNYRLSVKLPIVSRSTKIRRWAIPGFVRLAVFQFSGNSYGVFGKWEAKTL